MFAEAAGFALLSAISPTALLVMAVFLSSASPRQTALMYVAGATLMTVAMAVAVLYALRVAGLNQPRQHDPRYGLRLGLGVLALIAVGVLTWRGRRAASRSDSGRSDSGRSDSGRSAPGKGMMSRLIAHPTTLTAFVTGLVLFAPSATFIAAVQVIATASADIPSTALGLLIVVCLTVLIVWLPLLTYLVAPGATTLRLNMLNGWLRARGRTLVVGGLTIGGIVLIVNGALGVAGVV